MSLFLFLVPFCRETLFHAFFSPLHQRLSWIYYLRFSNTTHSKSPFIVIFFPFDFLEIVLWSRESSKQTDKPEISILMNVPCGWLAVTFDTNIRGKPFDSTNMLLRFNRSRRHGTFGLLFLPACRGCAPSLSSFYAFVERIMVYFEISRSHNVEFRCGIFMHANIKLKWLVKISQHLPRETFVYVLSALYKIFSNF